MRKFNFNPIILSNKFAGRLSFILKHRDSTLQLFVQTFTVIILFIGGLGLFNENYVNTISAIFGLIIIVFLLVEGRNLKIPKHFVLFSIFILILTLSLSWSRVFIPSFRQGMLFVAGWSFWLISYNVRKDITGWILNLIVILGIGFGILFVLNNFYHWPISRGLSLFLTPSKTGQFHFHIGDYWAIIGLITIFRLTKTPKQPFYWLMIPATAYFLFSSMSRGGIVALAVGIIFLILKGKIRISGRTKIIIASILTGLFVVNSISKSTFLSRPYFIQAIAGLKIYPFGVGLGNFSGISNNPKTHLFGLSRFSLYTHNIILEMISAVGILGLVFLIWFIFVIFDVFFQSKNKNLVFQAIFVVISTNFMFDYTYFIPTMCWLWFISLGQAQKE